MFKPALSSRLVWSTLLTLQLSAALASTEPLKGELQLNGSSSGPYENSFLYPDRTSISNRSASLRLIEGFSEGPWSGTVHYLASLRHGDSVSVSNPYSQQETLPWFDLDNTLSSTTNEKSEHRLDRVLLSYSGDNTIFRLGRQSLTWGNGRVFRPADLFNPFAPNSADTRYKPGVDMLYAQHLLAQGDDIELVVIPRRSTESNAIDSDLSSVAVQWHGYGDIMETTTMLARDYLDTTLALGLVGPIGEAIWRIDLVTTISEHDTTYTSLVANIEHAWRWGESVVTGFAEYFHSGLGLKDYSLIFDPSEPLLSKMGRGQLFTLGQDYISAGLNTSLTPLLSIGSLGLFNLADSSGLASLSAEYSIHENGSFSLGIDIPFGSDNTEYGGLEILPNQFFGPAPTLRGSLIWHF